MFGQGRPRLCSDLSDRVFLLSTRPCCARFVLRILVVCISILLQTDPCNAAETSARLRFVWGNNVHGVQRWVGQITVDAGSFSDLQPLGVETDAAVSLRLDGNRIIVDPLEKRSFDGCDVTVRAEETAMVQFALRTDQNTEPTIVEVPFKQLIKKSFHRQLGESEGYLLARRSPGDKLRVKLARDNLVFEPNEVWTVGLEADLAEELAEGPVQVELRLRRTGDSKVLWQAGRQVGDYESEHGTPEDGPLEFEVICPDQEDAYRLTISARRLESFATRLLPGQQAKVLSTRDVEFVVVDSQAKLPDLDDQLRPVLSINPANPRWWQRLPSWAQVSRLRGATLGSIGNIEPVVRPGPIGDLVELPPVPNEGEPFWQSYTLPVQEVGKLHVVEIQYPLDLKQHLAINVIEPDSSGRVNTSQRAAGFYAEGNEGLPSGEIGIHRFSFWPRTRSPQLLIVNRHSSEPAQYGKIELFRQDAVAETAESIESHRDSSRLVACYLSKPLFAEYLGASKLLDPSSGLSVQSWSTFLDGANRLAQHVRRNGFNAVVLSVAANGSSLYPSDLLNPSPRYDTGLLAENGQDPLRKDVIELLLRVFDREGLRVIPMLQLSTPLPRLELARRNSETQRDGIAWIGAEGRSWLEKYPAVEGRAPFYNVLNDRVQTELRSIASELTSRYSSHKSFAGIGLQLSGEGYGVLPGLTWGMDDATIASFSRDTGVQVPYQDARRFRRRAEMLLGKDLPTWRAWRSQKLTKLYTQISEELVAKRNDLRLLISTEDVFSGSEMQQQVRNAISQHANLSEILIDHGIDFSRLAQTSRIIALAPSRLGPSDRFPQRALDMRINSASDQGELLPLSGRSAMVFEHSVQHVRLPSFDALSPLGSGQTRLSLSCQPSSASPMQQRYLAKALAASDTLTLVEGGQLLTLSENLQQRRFRKTLALLPGPEADVHTQSAQPLVMRTYRTQDSTTVALINESPWPISVRLPVRSEEASAWVKLGIVNSSSSAEHSGALVSGEQEWVVELQPADLQAWRFDSTHVRPGQPQVTLDSRAREELRQRIEAIELRTGNLNIRRAYSQLKNSGFELESNAQQINGWQTLLGSQGRVEVDGKDVHSGTGSLKISSDSLAGIAIQSDPFPMPETGQLMLSGYVRGEVLSPETRLHIVFEENPSNSQNLGRLYRRTAVLAGGKGIDNKWSRFEFPVDDIPFNSDGTLRVQFHLTGESEILIDGLELVDLQFNKLHRGALVKGVYAAKTALAEGQVIDCLRLIEEYWSQYLIEYIPPAEMRTYRQAKQPSKPEVVAEEETPTVGGRLRGWLPKIWR